MLKSINRLQKLIAITDENDPDYKEYMDELEQLKDKQKKKEKTIWETALLITKFSTSACSERLSRAIELFNSGDDRGANAVLNEEEINRDIERNLRLYELGEEGKRGLIININEYRLKIRALHCRLNREDNETIIAFRQKIIEICIRLYGEQSIEVAEEYHELAMEYENAGNYANAQKSYETSINIFASLGIKDTLRYADILRGLGRLHVANDMYLKGKPYLEEALAIIGERFGVENITYVKSLRDMSMFYRNMDLYNDAQELADKALDISAKLPDFDKGLRNSIKKELAIVYATKATLHYNSELGYRSTRDPKDFDKAVNLLKEVYESEIEDKRASIDNLYLIGRIFENYYKWTYAKEPKLIAAADYYTKALTIAKEIDDKTLTDKLLKRIGSVYQTLGTPEKAEAQGYSYSHKAEANGINLSETILDGNIQNQETAERIVALYLDRFPRKESYGVTLSSSEDDSEMTFYHTLSEEELEILHVCSAIALQEDCTLGEILSDEGYDELEEKLVAHDTVFPLNIVSAIDLDTPLKFTKFHLQHITEDGSLGSKQTIGVELTDREFKEILIELLLHSKRYSMNMMAYHKPELCQKIMEHLTRASLDGITENWHPFIADMCEHKRICESILNPFIDVLDIFNHEDKAISKFAHQHQIVPEAGEIYIQTNGTDWFHCVMHFSGTKLEFHQEGLTQLSHRFHDLEKFSIDGRELMEKFALKTPEEIMTYLKEHYNTPDCFYRIKQEFEKE